MQAVFRRRRTKRACLFGFSSSWLHLQTAMEQLQPSGCCRLTAASRTLAGQQLTPSEIVDTKGCTRTTTFRPYHLQQQLLLLQPPPQKQDEARASGALSKPVTAATQELPYWATRLAQSVKTSCSSRPKGGQTAPRNIQTAVKHAAAVWRQACSLYWVDARSKQGALH